VADEGFAFEFAKDPVIAIRLPWVFDLRSVDGKPLRPPKEFREPWLVVNANASMHLLKDHVFRGLYHPTSDGSQRYLRSLTPVEDAIAGDPESDMPIRL
jgi:hypothetical protein